VWIRDGKMTIKFYWWPDWEWSMSRHEGIRINYFSMNLGRLEIVIFVS